MSEKDERDYIARHMKIVKELIEMSKEFDSACFSVAKIAARLGMDQRTIRAHLKVIEVDNIGAFVSAEQKEFCTKEGIIALAKKLGLTDISDDSRDQQQS